MAYTQECITPYGTDDGKASQVETMFDNIAPTYDRLNHRLSWNIDRSWRRRAIEQIAPFSPKAVLDIATGTGDFAIMAAQRLKPTRLVGADISEGMMEVGRRKAHDAGLDGIVSFERQDCLNMTFEDATFDAVMAAFGIRNFADLDRGLKEMCRVLKPGGHLTIVELTRPPRFPMRQLFWIYSHAWLPLYGRIISHDKQAYTYLIKTIEAFPQGEQMTDILRRAGFSKASFKRMTGGISTMYTATK